MNNFYYIGNGAYCYANSTSMLLTSIGENIEPSLIEVLTGTSIGIAVKLDMKKRSLSFDHSPTLLPDLGVTKALDILGFTYKTKVFDKEDDFSIAQEELKKDLTISPAIIGPVVIGHLTYNPDHKYLLDADHFILAYKIEGDFIYLHDPEKFPHVFLKLEQLKKAWRADGISYKKGYYRYTFAPKRIESPSNDEIYSRAMSFFKTIYQEGELKTDKESFEIGGEAVRNFAKYIGERGLDEKERGHFVCFALPLGAKRALDYFRFFSAYNKGLADLKYKQSVIFGAAHVYARDRNWNKLSKELESLAVVEEQFKNKLLEEKDI